MGKIGAKIFVNFITSLRIIGTFMMPFISNYFDAQKFVTYIILLLTTDSIDGLLARRFKVSTLFGALLDALADKILGISIILVIANHYHVMFLPVITECLIMLINVSGGFKGSSIDSSKLGKFKTFILGICIVISFLVIFAKDFINLFDNTTVLGIKIINIFQNFLTNPIPIINSLAFISFGSGLMVAFDYYLRAKKEIAINKEKIVEPKKYKLKRGKELKYALFNTDFYEKTKHLSVLNRLGYMEVVNDK